MSVEVDTQEGMAQMIRHWVNAKMTRYHPE
jgi:hypothetical protein